MRNKSLMSLVFVALFTALVFVATKLFQVPISIGWGYVHFGDAFVILSGMLLGPVLGFISAGVGSFLADMLSGYAHYAIPTLLVKGSVALFVGFGYTKSRSKLKNINIYYLRIVYQSVVSFIIVVGGYFLSDLILANLLIVDTDGSTALAFAAFGLIPNAIQIGIGIFIATLLYEALKKPFSMIYDK